jgi:hypothetical protein
VTSENVTVETRFGLLKPANLTPILKCVPLGSAQSELEGTTQREARDAWLNRGDYMVARARLGAD